MGIDNGKQVIVAFTLDFETGGLDCKEAACTQIAIHAVRIDTFETIDRYVRYIYPYEKQPDKGGIKKKVLRNKYEISEKRLMEYGEKALEISGVTMEKLYSQGVDMKQVAQEVIDFIKRNTMSKKRNMKPFLIGQNICFDVGFLQQLMEYADLMDEFSKLMNGHVDFYGHFQPQYIDTITLGQFALSHLDDVDSYKLELLAERFGVELDDAHDADADVTATTNVALVCAKRMRNVDGDADDGGLRMSKKEKKRAHFKI